jgi:Asp-tRNA(Asn)/Glu-tRNA(Gln) amidotransferase A subunit family amidase
VQHKPANRSAATVASDRRAFLAVCSSFGVATGLFPGLLWSKIQNTEKKITRDMIDSAAALAGLEIGDGHKDSMLNALNDQVDSFEKIRDMKLGNDISTALLFDPVLQTDTIPTAKRPNRLSRAPAVRVPANLDDLAFGSVRELAELVRTRRVSATSLTEMYIARLKRYDPLLHFVVTLTEDRAIAQAKEADREIAAGKYRGPLHGIPWGAKDLLSVKGYPTTWGAFWLREQRFDQDATVVQRLDAAGAVLVAKLTLGTLAMGGDEWFGGMTRNPWNPQQGATGSSAGSASAVAAGCVGFAIGSETLDSISSPAGRCGATGLRPTFGRVPRTGAMALCWSMDKLGPICRAVEDCALVLAAINGSDGEDRMARDVPFNWDATLDIRSLRVGYLKSEFEGDGRGIGENQETEAQRLERQKIERAALDVIHGMGMKITPVELPRVPWRAMLTIPKSEAAAAFDELIRTRHDLLLPQQKRTWPNIFRVARFTPAVDYINANRARLVGMQAMARIFQDFDVIVSPTSSVQLIVTNLTGHPAVILPSGFRQDGTPVSLTFLGNLFGEAKMLALARAYQELTSWHRKTPTL